MEEKADNAGADGLRDKSGRGDNAGDGQIRPQAARAGGRAWRLLSWYPREDARGSGSRQGSAPLRLGWEGVALVAARSLPSWKDPKVYNHTSIPISH